MLRVCWMKFDILAAPNQSLERGLVLFNQQSHHNLTITRISTVLDQGYIAIADVLIDHGITLDTQSINSLRTNTAKQEAWHRDCFVAFNDVQWSTRSNPPQQLYLAESIRVVYF